MGFATILLYSTLTNMHHTREPDEKESCEIWSLTLILTMGSSRPPCYIVLAMPRNPRVQKFPSSCTLRNALMLTEKVPRGVNNALTRPSSIQTQSPITNGSVSNNTVRVASFRPRSFSHVVKELKKQPSLRSCPSCALRRSAQGPPQMG